MSTGPGTSQDFELVEEYIRIEKPDIARMFQYTTVKAIGNHKRYGSYSACYIMHIVIVNGKKSKTIQNWIADRLECALINTTPKKWEKVCSVNENCRAPSKKKIIKSVFRTGERKDSNEYIYKWLRDSTAKALRVYELITKPNRTEQLKTRMLQYIIYFSRIGILNQIVALTVGHQFLK